jgi:hypothetical protein
MILQSERGSEESHEAVAQELVDSPLVAVHSFGHQSESPAHELVHRLRIQPFGELGRLYDIAKEHCNLLALTFERALERKDLLGEVLGSVRRYGGETCFPGDLTAYRRAALVAEAGVNQ